MEKFLYVGPSWAANSFDRGDKYHKYSTNLAKEWGFQYESIARDGASNSGLINEILYSKQEYVYNNFSKIIWVYCEPLRNITDWHTFTNQHPSKSNGDKIAEMILKSDDIFALRKEIAHRELKTISKLKIPIGFIGSHSDLPLDILSKYPNMHVIHESWQKWLAEHINYDKEITIGWGAEQVQKIISWYGNKIDPSKHVIFETYKHLKFWGMLVKKDLFWHAHPNRKAHELFAKFLYPKIEEFLIT